MDSTLLSTELQVPSTHIGKNTKLISFGFVRQSQKLLPNQLRSYFTIPLVIYHLCFNYYYDTYEWKLLIGDLVIYNSQKYQTDAIFDDGNIWITNKNNPKLSYLVQSTKVNVFFEPHLSISDAAKLKRSDQIDFRDCEHQTFGLFFSATIIGKVGRNLKIHYDGFSNKYDLWSDYSKSAELKRFAELGSNTGRPAHRYKDLKVDDFVELNPTLKDNGWRTAQIEKFSRKSGQVQLKYIHNNEDVIYWTHLDNVHEIALEGNHYQTKQAISSIATIQSKKSCKTNRNQKCKNNDYRNDYRVGDRVELKRIRNGEKIKATVVHYFGECIDVHLDGFYHKILSTKSINIAYPKENNEFKVNRKI